MTAQSGPYLREDLAVGRSTRVKINQDYPYRTEVPQRLLETLDQLYLLLDEKTEALENLSRTGIKLRHQEIELRREIHNLKRTTFQHKDLPEDVQLLREEAAAWKDEYATLKQVIASMKIETADQEEALDAVVAERDALRASRKKWRRRARRADRVVVEQAEAIREGMAQEARNMADMKRSNEALQRRICLEDDDHRLIIRLAAEGFQEWLREEKIISAANHGDLTAEYLRGDVAVTEINQAKRELL